MRSGLEGSKEAGFLIIDRKEREGKQMMMESRKDGRSEICILVITQTQIVSMRTMSFSKAHHVSSLPHLVVIAPESMYRVQDWALPQVLKRVMIKDQSLKVLEVH